MMCVFCKIMVGEIPSERIFEDEHVIVIRDIQPQAPVHCLIIPRHHIPSISALKADETFLVGHMIQIAKDVAIQEKIAEKGYRLVFNVNDDGGQTVPHIHLHLLGGRGMHWPPG